MKFLRIKTRDNTIIFLSIAAIDQICIKEGENDIIIYSIDRSRIIVSKNENLYLLTKLTQLSQLNSPFVEDEIMVKK